jgi:NAD(P)-dependent dehydrogenase (short-subunit alcohol dehydrogenase family)
MRRSEKRKGKRKKQRMKNPPTSSTCILTFSAVVGLTKSDGLHYAPHGIRINAVCPGYVDTPLLVDAIERDKLDSFLRHAAKVPVPRLIDSDEIADGIVFLASQMSSAMQASTLALDLGLNSSS